MMSPLSRCLVALAFLVAGAACARKSKRTRVSVDDKPATKFIAGVPVVNYHMAYDGKASLSELESEEEQEWVIMVKPGTTDDQVQHMCKTSKKGCNRKGHVNGGVPFLELRGTERDLEAVLKASDSMVKYVEPDAEVWMIPELKADNVEAATWGLTRIGANQRGTSGAGATVFVLDTGVRVSHQEFGDRASPAIDMSSGGLVECNGDQSCAGDNQGHGTHCAGSAAGQTYGVAPAAAVRAIKVLSDSGSGSWSWSYSALDWLATSTTRPAVASMSLGGSGNLQGMADAVDSAVSAGVTVVVAGGNENSNACGFSPAFVPSAITVGSTTSLDRRSYFSNYGECTDIWAPGSDVLSAGHSCDGCTATMSGTSMACPHVSGGAALLLSADPSKKSAEVLSDLLGNAVMNAIVDLKQGDTNALLYVGEGGPPPTPEPVPTPAPLGCPETSTGPDSDGDCSCRTGLRCHNNGVIGRCPASYTSRSDRYFFPSCASCECLDPSVPNPPPAPTPPTPPTPAPPPCPSDSAGPDGHGDCRCGAGLICHEDGTSGCTFSSTATHGGKSTLWFLSSCSSCGCIAEARPDAAPPAGARLLFAASLLALTLRM